jgi:hypothetical protein
VTCADLVGLNGAIGGGGVLALFPAGTALFGAHGIGLFLGYFGYLGMLFVLVWRSRNGAYGTPGSGAVARPARPDVCGR